VPQPIVEYAEFRKAYTRPRQSYIEDGKWMTVDKFVAPMGTFRWNLLTQDGESVLGVLKSFHLPAPKYRGVSQKAVYFKWDCSVHVTREKVNGETVETKHSTKDAILVAADAIRDMGYDVVVEYLPREIKEWLDGPLAPPVRVRFQDQYKMVIKHPE